MGGEHTAGAGEEDEAGIPRFSYNAIRPAKQEITLGFVRFSVKGFWDLM